MTRTRLQYFSVDLVRARDLIGLGQRIGLMTHGVVDSSDLYRAALVQGVAALDRYVHGVILDRSVELIFGRITVLKPSKKLGLPFHAVGDIFTQETSTEQELTARGMIARQLSLETFQRPDDIAAALTGVGIPKFWAKAFPGEDKSSLMQESLSKITRRRNAIAHQCDYDPTLPGQVTEIDPGDVVENLAIIQVVVQAIDDLLNPSPQLVAAVASHNADNQGPPVR